MISADLKTNLKQEIKNLVTASSQNLTFNVKQASIFHLILVGIPCLLILSTKNGASSPFLMDNIRIHGMGGVRQVLLNDQSLLSMMKIIVQGFYSGFPLHLNSKFISNSSSPFQRCKNFM